MVRFPVRTARGWGRRGMGVLIGVAGTVLASAAHAQDWVFVAPHTGTVIPVEAKNADRFAERPAPTKSLKAGNLSFNITYDDVDGSHGDGFDDPSEGAARQAAVDAALTYVNEVLNENTGATLDITFLRSQFDGTGFLAQAGTFFSTSPEGFQGGIALEHITTGTDPSGSVVDIEVTVDFGHPWHSDHTTSPGGSEFDLFSVLLHEITHGLGIATLSDADGNSTVFNPPENPGVYTFWDGLIRLDSGSPQEVWKNDDPNVTAFQQTAAALTSQNLFFSGSNAESAFGSLPPIYAPASFESGSSLSHYDSGITGGSVMEPNITNGEEVREYTALDIASLVDLGYTDAAEPTDGGPDPEPLSSSGGGLTEAGRTVSLTASFENEPASPTYQWLRNGSPVSNGGNVSGANSTELVLDPVSESDEGTYRLRLDDGEGKAFFFSDPIDLIVAAPGGLPAVSFVGLGLLTGAIAASGGIALKRRRR